MAAMRIETILVTPAKARELLAANIRKNRRVRRSSVSALASLISRDEFKLTHQPIAISTEGELLDGQHRLRAIIEANKGVHLAIARNVDPNTFDAIDFGGAGRRTVADILQDDPKVTQVASFFAVVLYDKSFASAARISAIHKVVGAAARKIYKAHEKGRRLITVAPLKAALALKLLTGTDEAYALQLYADLADRRYAKLPPVALSYLNQADTGKLSSHQRFDLFLRGLVMFDPANKDMERLKVFGPENALAEARHQLIDLLTRKGAFMPDEAPVEETAKAIRAA